MSYVVHIWEHPEPKNLMAADRLHEYLADRPSSHYKKWRRLRDDIESRMAALQTPMEWIEGPLDPEHRERTYGVLFEGPENFEQVLIRSATSLGFSVYDDQAARCYLPFGYVLSHDGHARVNWGDGAPMPARIGAADREAVMARCEAAWRPRFEAIGFRFGRGEPWHNELLLVADRTVPVGKHQISVSFCEYQGKLSFHVVAAILPDIPEAVRQASGGKQIQIRGREYRGMAAFMLHSSYEPLVIGGSLRNTDYVDRLIDALFEYLDEEILPTLDACRTAQETLRVASRELELPGFTRPSALTLALAWLEGDAMLERLREAYAKSDPDWEQGPAACDALRALSRG